MSKIYVNDKGYDFNYTDIPNTLGNALFEYEKENGCKPWGFLMGMPEYASLVSFMRDHYLGDTSAPIKFDGIPCFPNKEYDGKVVVLEGFETLVHKG